MTTAMTTIVNHQPREVGLFESWAAHALDKAVAYRRWAAEMNATGHPAKAKILRDCAWRFIAFAKEYRARARYYAGLT